MEEERQKGRKRGSGGRVGVGDKAMTSCRSALVACAAPLPAACGSYCRCAYLWQTNFHIDSAGAPRGAQSCNSWWHAIIRQQSCKECGAERQRERGIYKEKESMAKR